MPEARPYKRQPTWSKLVLADAMLTRSQQLLAGVRERIAAVGPDVSRGAAHELLAEAAHEAIAAGAMVLTIVEPPSEDEMDDGVEPEDDDAGRQALRPRCGGEAVRN